MAMVIGILAKKRVVSSVPVRNRGLMLPFSEIEYITDSEWRHEV